MSENKPTHTPGPWYTGAADKRPAGKQVSAGYHCGECPGYWGVGNGTAAIARILITGCVTNGEAIANARLVAAAPELLAALSAVVEGWDSLPCATGGIVSKAKLDAARAAIAKAEGR